MTRNKVNQDEIMSPTRKRDNTEREKYVFNLRLLLVKWKFKATAETSETPKDLELNLYEPLYGLRMVKNNKKYA